MNISNARVPAQRKQMVEIQKEGVCPFCPKYFKKYHDAPIIKETDKWLITKNDYPYEGSKLHLLLVHKKHIENVSELSPKAAQELIHLTKWAEKEFKMKGGILLMRFGKPEYTGATITHLHAHVVVGEKEGKGREKLKTSIGFQKKKQTP